VKIIKNICENPGQDFPLIYIVGKSGLGKTHLIHASYKELSKKSPVYFSSGRDFYEFYQEQCGKFGHSKTLRDFVNSFDVLILDDIEEVYQEKDFQSYFCHLYNHFSFKKRQIILSGFNSPKDLMDTVPKFYSRINSGLIQEIGPMDQDLAISYLEKISQDNNISLNSEMKREILTNYQNDGRSLKGAITSFKASNLISNHKFVAPPPAPIPVNIPLDDYVVRNISKEFQLEEAEVYSPSRRKELIPARHLAMYLLHTVLGISLFQVGKKFNRDHTSVIYAVSKIEEKMKVDQKFSQSIETISTAIKNKSYFSPKDETVLYH